MSPAATPEPANVRVLCYRRLPGLALNLYVHLPPDWRATDRRAGLVFCHGGGWASHNHGQFREQAGRLAELGLVAARADYRSRPDDHATMHDLLGDVRSAIRYLRAHAGELGLAPERLAAAGGSAGGHLAACAATVSGFDHPDDDARISCVPQALVLFNPVLDVGDRPRDLNGLDARAISPCHHVTAATPPSILFYGTADWALPGGQRFALAAQAAGVACELVTYPEQPHAFFNREPYKAQTLDEAIRFLRAQGFLAP